MSTQDPIEEPSVVPTTDFTALGPPQEQLIDKMEDVAALLRDLKKVKADQKKTWTWVKGGAGFILFDVLITVLGAIGIITMYGIINEVEDQGAKLQTSIHETCSLYGFVIQSYNQMSRDRSPLGPEAYDNFYRQLQGSADRLECHIPHKI